MFDVLEDVNFDLFEGESVEDQDGSLRGFSDLLIDYFVQFFVGIDDGDRGLYSIDDLEELSRGGGDLFLVLFFEGIVFQHFYSSFKALENSDISAFGHYRANCKEMNGKVVEGNSISDVHSDGVFDEVVGLWFEGRVEQYCIVQSDDGYWIFFYFLFAVL